MKNAGITIFVVLIIATLGLYLFSFQVRETEAALVTTFGKPTRDINEPGWYFKWPRPVQQVHKFDSRMKVLEADLGETTTAGAVPIIVNTYVVWKITEPQAFFNAHDQGNIIEAERKLISHISDTQNRVVGQHTFGEFVNSDSTLIRLPFIEEEMLNELRQSIVDTNYGIEIKTVGIKQLKVNADVTQKVFDRMRAERNRRTQATIAEGNAEAETIKTDADSKSRIILAAAEARAKAIRGRGDAQAAQYYELLEEEPELAIFLRNLEALEKILSERATIILPGDSEPFKLLKELPDFNPNPVGQATEETSSK